MARAKWKDQLRPAKFRGLNFFIDSSSFETGRRGALHEFPGRDIPYKEDLGRKARAYPIEGYVLGSDYRTQKDKIISACEKEGPGELNHPYYGKLTVCCETITVTESAGEGGFCKFSFKFVEAGEVKFPTALKDHVSEVSGKADLLNSSAIASFSDKLNVIQQAQFVVDSATDRVTAFTDSMSSVIGKVNGTASDIANLAFSIRDLKANIKDLLNTPSQLAEKMKNAFDLLEKAVNPSDLFDAAKNLFNFGSNNIGFNRTTASRAQQASNSEAISSIVQTFAISKASVSATTIDFVSTQDAVKARNILTAQIDTMSEVELNDEVYSALQNLRAQIVKAVPAPEQDLARITTFTPIATLPALALTYDRYGSLDLVEDLISRNNISHPGFIRGGIPLEILDRG